MSKQNSDCNLQIENNEDKNWWTTTNNTQVHTNIQWSIAISHQQLNYLVPERWLILVWMVAYSYYLRLVEPLVRNCYQSLGSRHIDCGVLILQGPCVEGLGHAQSRYHQEFMIMGHLEMVIRPTNLEWRWLMEIHKGPCDRGWVRHLQIPPRISSHMKLEWPMDFAKISCTTWRRVSSWK